MTAPGYLPVTVRGKPRIKLWHAKLYQLVEGLTVGGPPVVWPIPPGRSRASMSAALSRHLLGHYSDRKVKCAFYARTMFVVRVF
jgi:hypothetical protein